MRTLTVLFCIVFTTVVLYAYGQLLWSMDTKFLHGFGAGTLVTVMTLYVGSLLEKRAKEPD